MAETTTGHRVYAAFTGSDTIASFKIQNGCGLVYLGSVSAKGLNGGAPLGLASHGNIMVVTYGDGSIESFNIQGTVPVSNGDLQVTTGYTDGNGGSAAGVQITFRWPLCDFCRRHRQLHGSRSLQYYLRQTDHYD